MDEKSSINVLCIMLIIAVISILFAVLYLILVLHFIIGWKRTDTFIAADCELPDIFISVIVPCKNEAMNIQPLLLSLAGQNYRNYELILVNDHSDDATLEYLLSAKAKFSNIRVVDAVGCGKKNALQEGIQQSSGDLVVTTDADCMHSKRWLQTIATFQCSQPSDLIICPVLFSQRNSLFSTLQRFEFVSLVASGAGAAGVGKPILCNGANLAFTKTVWQKNQMHLHDEEQSGDDIFLLESIKKQNGIIRFLKSKDAFVVVEPAYSLNVFFKQRRRWAAKSPTYTDWQIITTACIVFGISLLLVTLIGLSFYNPRYLFLFFSVFVVKYLVDASFLYSVRRFFQIQKVWINSFILSMVYPFYIVVVALNSLLIKPKSW